MRVSGEILITFGLVILLFAAYEVYGKASAIEAHQNTLSHQLDQAWAQPAPAAATPTQPARPARHRDRPPLHPRHEAALGRRGGRRRRRHPVCPRPLPRHRDARPDRQLQRRRPPRPAAVLGPPGGAAGRSGRRTDPGHWYVYRVTANEIVTPHSIEVVAPTPDRIGVAPTTAMLTLTTCNPKWNDYQRMVVHAELVTTTPYGDGPPVALGS